MAERAGEVPVRITLTWDFEPGAPARWLRMNKNRYAIEWAARGGPWAFSKLRGFSERISGISREEPAIIRHDGWHSKRILRYVW